MMKAWILTAAAMAAGPAWASAERPSIEVVFVLDTTGSMGGLLDGAKRKVWAIVNEMAKGKPEPKIKMGLVAYRDRGDAYVTQVEPLSSNLDAVYEKLLALQAGGGGDGPEDVLSAMRDAVEKAGWSKSGKALRVVYLVGDAPPHQEYRDVPKLTASLEKAVRAGIRVHAIRCGGDALTGQVWQEVARLGEGRFFSIDQTGGVAVVETPFDVEIARLHRELETTTVAFGRGAEETEKSLALGGAIMAAAPASASADRAAFKAREGFHAEGDLVAAVKDGGVKLEALKDEELPEPFRGKTLEEKRARLDEVQKKRDGLASKLAKLNKKREEHLAKSAKAAGRDSFDAKVIEALREDAKKAGIRY